MKINGKEAKHIVIRDKNGNDIIFIGEEEIINQSNGFTICITDENHRKINTEIRL